MEMETKDAIERFNELCRCLNGTRLWSKIFYLRICAFIMTTRNLGLSF